VVLTTGAVPVEVADVEGVDAEDVGVEEVGVEEEVGGAVAVAGEGAVDTVDPEVCVLGGVEIVGLGSSCWSQITSNTVTSRTPVPVAMAIHSS
jgi:hypothetical protein